MLLKKCIVILNCLWLCSSSEDLNDHHNWKYLPKDDCGLGSSTDRIVGGKEASLGQYPWMARIGYDLKSKQNKLFFLCGGTIISRYYVLTAAHCLVADYAEKIAGVRLGEHDVDEEIDCEGDLCAPPVQDILIENYFTNEGFQFTTKQGDIGLIELASAIKFNDFVSPICLPRGEFLTDSRKYLPVGLKVESAGWGVTDALNNQLAVKLMTVQIPLNKLDSCIDSYHDDIDFSQLCAGLGMGEDTCLGDSGGPIMKPFSLTGHHQQFIIGIVSFGAKFCGVGPAVYTNVTHYMEWILDRISK